jgi:FKBP-type peptidyl-prolyl cis-trans isomerase FkpA
MIRNYLLCLLALAGDVGALAGCRRPTTTVTGEPEALTYSKALSVKLDDMTKSPSGLYTRDETVGQGEEARKGYRAFVHYTGWLVDGREFDSSRGRNEPFDFQIGAGEVIAGWDEGVEGMRVGGRHKLVVPPELGYGSQTMGPIPAGSTLVFDVELLEVR